MVITDLFFISLILLAVILIFWICFKNSFPSDSPALPITNRRTSSSDKKSTPRKSVYIIVPSRQSSKSKSKSSKLRRTGWLVPMYLGGASNNHHNNSYDQDQQSSSPYELSSSPSYETAIPSHCEVETV